MWAQDHQAVVNSPECPWQRSRQNRTALRGNADLILNKFGHFQHLAGVHRWMFIQPFPPSLFITLWCCKVQHLIQLSLCLWAPLLGWVQGQWPMSLALPMCLPLALDTSHYLALVIHMVLIQTKVGYLPSIIIIIYRGHKQSLPVIHSVHKSCLQLVFRH